MLKGLSLLLGIANQDLKTKDRQELVESMVSVEQLSSLDCLIWLQAGQLVAKTIAQHQTTVSRHQRKCASAFGIQVGKQDGEWRISGDTALIELERAVHQAARLRGQSQLRLEAAAPDTAADTWSVPETWLVGCSRLQRTEHFTQLLRQRIIDAWLVTPQHQQPTDASIQLVPLHKTSEQGVLAVRADLQPMDPVVDLAQSLTSVNSLSSMRRS